MRVNSFCYTCNDKRTIKIRFKPIFENHGNFDTVSMKVKAICETCNKDMGEQLSLAFSTFIFHKPK